MTLGPDINLARTTFNGFGCWTAKHHSCLPFTSECAFWREQQCLYAPKKKDCNKKHNHPQQVKCDGTKQQNSKLPRAEASSAGEGGFGIVDAMLDMAMM